MRVVAASVELSNDRRTLSVTTFYPVVGHCIKNADGLEVDFDGDVAVVSAWMRSDTPAGALCTLECGFVTQSITLDVPVPATIGFVSSDDAFPGCGTIAGGPTTTTIA
jgi:hypothetical protein